MVRQVVSTIVIQRIVGDKYLVKGNLPLDEYPEGEKIFEDGKTAEENKKAAQEFALRIKEDSISNIS